MIVETARRVQGPDFAPPTVICNNHHRFLVAAAFQQAEINPRAILLEPVARNTGAAIAAAAMQIHKNDPEAWVLVLPSDHYIQLTKQFQKTIKQAIPTVKKGYLATFSIQPDAPETGYGYIRHGEKLTGDHHFYKVTHFKEKPNRETAQSYLDAGCYSWNAGIFFASARVLVDQFQTHCLDLYEPVKEAVAAINEDLDFLRLGQSFAEAPDIAFDYAVMEHTEKAIVQPLSVGWSDIGTWDRLWEISEKTGSGNVFRGQVCGLDLENCYLRSDQHDLLLAAIGLKDIVAVASDNVVMVAKKSEAQRVRDLLKAINNNKQKQFKQSALSRQPWGYSRVVKAADQFSAKEVMIKPGYQTATQIHKKRSEHWVILKGVAEVTIDGQTMTIQKGQSAHIPTNSPHSLSNRGTEPLIIFEVQAGEISPDDIIRIERMDKGEPESSATRKSSP